MTKNLTRRGFVASAAGAAMLGALVLTGCGGQEAAKTVKIGSMPTEDILPLWVAERDGLFEQAGVDVEIVLFDSAQTLTAAITAGEVDLAMTDPMRAVKLAESGTAVTMEWTTLGADASQGRFGVLGSGSEFAVLRELQLGVDPDAKGYCGSDASDAKPTVGLAANTVPEYVFEKLCEKAGVSLDRFEIQEVPSLPDRFGLVANGKLDAGAFPGSMLALGEATGLVMLADDTKGDNISQSVMVAHPDFNTEANAKNMSGVRNAWDAAADVINADPDAQRGLLAEKANLNEKVVDSYPVSTYPHANDSSGNAAHPAADIIAPQIEWMTSKGYAEGAVTYNESDGSFTIG